MYSIKNVFTQEPATVSAGVMTLIAVALAWFPGLEVSAEQIAVTEGGLATFLALFYVRPLTASKSALTELSDNAKVVEAAVVVAKKAPRSKR